MLTWSEVVVFALLTVAEKRLDGCLGLGRTKDKDENIWEVRRTVTRKEKEAGYKVAGNEEKYK